MTLLSEIGNQIASFVSPRRIAGTWTSPNTDGRNNGTKLKVSYERKRSAQSPQPIQQSNKKIRLDDDMQGQTDESVVAQERQIQKCVPLLPNHDSKTTARSKITADRELMPPPGTPRSHDDMHKLGQQRWFASPRSRGSSYDNDEDNVTQDDLDGPPRPQIVHSNDEIQERYEIAMNLPENSGIWAEAEKDLFYRLALRGVEPLLPKNWMRDFKTFPLSCFAYQHGAVPIIQPQLEGDFRAIRALRELVDLGQRVRDRAMATRSLQAEPLILKHVNRYILWALSDVDMHPDRRPNVIPVHTIAAMQPGQTTANAIAEITSKLHKLAARYRKAYDIHTTIESRDLTPISNDETQVLQDDENLPILTGIMICASLVVILTLNPHTTPPTLPSSPKHPAHPSTPTQLSLDEVQPESGLRFIATFDFSESGQDVWNALAIAIVAIHIRKTMVRMYEQARATGRKVEEEMWALTENEAVKGNKAKRRAVDSDDPDA